MRYASLISVVVLCALCLLASGSIAEAQWVRVGDPSVIIIGNPSLAGSGSADTFDDGEAWGVSAFAESTNDANPSGTANIVGQVRMKYEW